MQILLQFKMSHRRNLESDPHSSQLQDPPADGRMRKGVNELTMQLTVFFFLLFGIKKGEKEGKAQVKMLLKGPTDRYLEYRVT